MRKFYNYNLIRGMIIGEDNKCGLLRLRLAMTKTASVETPAGNDCLPYEKNLLFD
jgi:hypothetical protein